MWGGQNGEKAIGFRGMETGEPIRQGILPSRSYVQQASSPCPGSSAGGLFPPPGALESCWLAFARYTAESKFCETALNVTMKSSR